MHLFVEKFCTLKIQINGHFNDIKCSFDKLCLWDDIVFILM